MRESIADGTLQLALLPKCPRASICFCCFFVCNFCTVQFLHNSVRNTVEANALWVKNVMEVRSSIPYDLQITIPLCLSACSGLKWFCVDPKEKCYNGVCCQPSQSQSSQLPYGTCPMGTFRDGSSSI